MRHEPVPGFWIAVAGALSAELALAQSCPGDIRGGWESDLPVPALFDVAIELEMGSGGEFTARLVSSGVTDDAAVWQDTQSLRMQSDRFAIVFEGRQSAESNAIDGFVEYSSNLYRVNLRASGSNRWYGTWSPLPLVAETVDVDLYFDDDGAGGTGGYLFFRDDRLPCLFASGAKCSGRRVDLREKNLGLMLAGEFDDEFSELRATITALGGSANIVFARMSPERQASSPGCSDVPARPPGESSYYGWAPQEFDDGWRTAPPSHLDTDIEPLAEFVRAVSRGRFPKTHSVLVSRSGYLVFEEYFFGFDRDILHDMRSASKSLTSTRIGLAIDRHLIDGSDAKVRPFFPEYRSYEAWDPRKAAITIRNLMTMSSGLDANDSDPNSVAAEWAYQSQAIEPDWVKFALDAPMIADPGTRLIYAGANPLVLGGVLDNVVDGRVEWFAEEALFRPLGVDTYRIFMDPTGVPYMGGGMYLRTRDMLKIGQMYLDGGRWQGQQILSEVWVEELFGRYGRLEPLDRNGNEYGFLWWHEKYVVNGKEIETVEARGNGGQYIFIVPKLELAAVIPSGNHRAGLTITHQPQRILEQYILPALVQ